MNNQKHKEGDVQIDKNTLVVKGSRKAEGDRFEWRLESAGGKSFTFRADKLGEVLGQERHKAIMLASLKKEDGKVLIQAMTKEDARIFRNLKKKIEVDDHGWASIAEARKAAELLNEKELELCKCAFTRERLKNIEVFGVELEEVASAVMNIDELREKKMKEMLGGKNLV